MANKNKIDTIERPMSPHLQVYKISFTMIMSMMHRISGFILYLGSFLFLVWYLSIFFGQDAYNYVNQLFSLSIVIRLHFLIFELTNPREIPDLLTLPVYVLSILLS